MRFYTDEEKPERVHTEELYPHLSEEDAARKMLRCGLLPSVTTVLDVNREEHIEKWLCGQAIQEYAQNGNKAKEAVSTIYTRESDNANFGTDCHEVVEMHMLGGDTPVVSDEVKAHAAPALRWLKDNVKRVIAAEMCRASSDLGVAGTVDMVFETKGGELVVGDLKVVKFSYKFPPHPGFSYRMQLSAYEQMMHEVTGDRYKRWSFYLASPFGWDKKPELRIFKHERDSLPAFRLCRQLWEEKLMQEDLTYDKMSAMLPTVGFP